MTDTDDNINLRPNRKSEGHPPQGEDNGSSPVTRMEYYHVHLRISDGPYNHDDGFQYCELTYMGSGLAIGTGERLRFQDRIQGVVNVRQINMYPPQTEVDNEDTKLGKSNKTISEYRIEGPNPLYIKGEIRAVYAISESRSLLGLHIPYATDEATFVVDFSGSSVKAPSHASASVRSPSHLEPPLSPASRPTLISSNGDVWFISTSKVQAGSDLIFSWNSSGPEDQQGNSKMRTEIFFSYAHKDKEWLRRFQITLRPLARGKKIAVWSDENIEAGDRWRQEIDDALRRAKVAVLLVTVDFLASEFIANNELPEILKSQEDEGLRILWVPVGKALYEASPLEAFQAAHNPGNPLKELSEALAEGAIVDICRKIVAAAAWK